MSQGFECDIHDAAAGGFFSAKASSYGKRLSRNDARDRIADLLAISIHDPSHDLCVSADIRGWHIFIRSD
jgi:hypothetical protein